MTQKINDSKCAVYFNYRLKINYSKNQYLAITQKIKNNCCIYRLLKKYENI